MRKTVLPPLVNNVCCALEGAKIKWCLLRDPEHAQESTGDVDLLVDRSDTERLQQVLGQLGLVRFPWVAHSPGLMFLGHDRVTGGWMWLHVVEQVSFGRCHSLLTSAEQGCLARRQCHGSLVVLAPDDRFWATLLHCMLDQSSISERYRAELQKLATDARVDGELGSIVGVHCPLGWTPSRLLGCVRSGDWNALEGSALDLHTEWLQHQFIGARVRIMRGWLRHVNRLRCALPQRGANVALLGPDGAGKSTVATSIESRFFSPVRTIYMGLGHGRPRAFTYFRGPGLYTLGALLTQWWRYLHARGYQARGWLVIFDRYTYDSMPTSSRPLSKLHLAGRWLRAHACPAPELVLLLDVPGKVMYDRKGERDPESLEVDRQNLLGLQQWVPHLWRIDASRSAEEVSADVMDRIWELYATRWGRG
jgi:thymidylate kinase